MSEKRNPQSQRRKTGGLTLHERHGHWHAAGTIKLGKKQKRIRQSLGISADRPRAEAEILRAKLEADAIDDLIHGRGPSVKFAIGIESWLSTQKPSPHDKWIADRLKEYCGDLMLTEIDSAFFETYVEQFLRDEETKKERKESTINRHRASFMAILNHANEKGWLEKVPKLPKRKEPRVKANRRLSFEEIGLLIEHAATHVKPILAVLAATGIRVGEAVYLDILDIDLAPDRRRLTVHNKKNDTIFTAAIPPWAVPFLRSAGADRRRGSLFLTHRGKPYVNRESKYGGQIKTAFNTARERVAVVLEARDEPERAAALREATPHSLRHSFASHMLAAGHSIIEVMGEGRWLDERVLLGRYGHLSPGQLAPSLDIENPGKKRHG
jgi:integrase